MKPRKHAAVIKAWADGAKVEYYSTVERRWKPIEEPAFSEKVEYRVVVPSELSDVELEAIYNNAYQHATPPLYPVGVGHRVACRAIAKAAVERFKRAAGIKDFPNSDSDE